MRLEYTTWNTNADQRGIQVGSRMGSGYTGCVGMRSVYVTILYEVDHTL